MDDDWLRHLSERNELNLAHECIDGDGIVLTAPTRALQAFVIKHMDGKEMFGEPEVYRRSSPAE